MNFQLRPKNKTPQQTLQLDWFSQPNWAHWTAADLVAALYTPCGADAEPRSPAICRCSSLAPELGADSHSRSCANSSCASRPRTRTSDLGLTKCVKRCVTRRTVVVAVWFKSDLCWSWSPIGVQKLLNSLAEFFRSKGAKHHGHPWANFNLGSQPCILMAPAEDDGHLQPFGSPALLGPVGRLRPLGC